MKKNDWILVTSVLLYSYLFYHQSAGINFLIFSLMLIIGLVLRNKTLPQNKNWLAAMAGTLLSAVCVAIYGSNLALTANIISLSVLSGLSMSAQSSIVFTLLFSAYSYVTSLIFMYFDWLERKQKSSSFNGNSPFKKILLTSVPLLITLLFFQLYKASNPLFNEFSAKINFNFISPEWITFTIGGTILIYGFYYHKQVSELAAFDKNGTLNLISTPHKPFLILGKEIGINDEIFSGTFMFLLLNLLLCVVNLLDFNFIFIDHQLPAGMTYSEFVHQGTGTVIASILVAISIILFYFRGALNFYKQSKTLKILAYCWIVQNVLMLISTAFRNDLYIAEYGLTYKRIGVYVYLLLAALGLASTFIKILSVKSNHFLLKVNGWMFYGVLVVASFFNWDVIITEYNSAVPKQIEKGYLVTLSDKVLPQLFALEGNEKLKQKQFVNDTYVSHIDAYNIEEVVPPSSYEQQLSRKLYYFMENSGKHNWQSWYYYQSLTISNLKKLNKNGGLKELDLGACRISSLAHLRDFDQLTALKLNRNNINLSELSYFSKLRHLELQQNNLKSIHGLHALPMLEFIDISMNPISNFEPLFELKKLKKIVLNKGINPSIIERLNTQFPGIIIQFS